MHKLVALSAFLIPAIAFAQPDTTTIVTPPADPPPANPPVVIVNPPPAQPTRTVITEPQYETVYDSYNAPVFTSGALMFLGSYGASVIVAASAGDNERDNKGTNRLYVPIAGPWLALNDRPSCPVADENCDNETTKKVLLVVDGLFQAAGVVGMIDGILDPSSHRIVTQTGKLDTKVHVTPTTVGEYSDPGLAVFGHF